jgi:hypothetical protein
VRYPVPGWPGFLGLELFAQGFFLHTPDPASWRTGNLARLRVAR